MMVFCVIGEIWSKSLVQKNFEQKSKTKKKKQ